jgi:hypothetical protein
MRRVVVALGAGVVGYAVLSGCAPSNLGGPPTVLQDELQQDISQRLTNGGERPESVTCDGPLVGEVGKSTRCDVVLSPTNQFQPVVTVTNVQDTTVSYEIHPAMSKEQLQAYISTWDADNGMRARSVSCGTGLDGAPGAVAYCDSDATTGMFRHKVEVSEVDNLMMKLTVVPVHR